MLLSLHLLNDPVRNEEEGNGNARAGGDGEPEHVDLGAQLVLEVDEEVGLDEAPAVAQHEDDEQEDGDVAVGEDKLELAGAGRPRQLHLQPDEAHHDQRQRQEHVVAHEREHVVHLRYGQYS